MFESFYSCNGLYTKCGAETVAKVLVESQGWEEQDNIKVKKMFPCRKDLPLSLEG